MSIRRHLRTGEGWGRVLTVPVAIIGAGGLLVSGIGVADAATGGSFLLGKANSESSTATLSNTRGIPLSLKAKPGYPPLAVNSSKLVARLNAAEVGGLTAAKLQRRLTGGTCPTGIGNVAASGGATCAHDQLIFTSNGSFTVPTNVTHVTGELWGGGGGGGSMSASCSPFGGGAGGYAEVLVTVTPGQQYDVTVGSGGGGAPQGGNQGGQGGNSAIANGGLVLVQAGGGVGGAPVVAPCTGTAPGGSAFLFSMSGTVLGLSRATGAAGTDASGGGAPGFAGSGGAPGSAGAGSAGQPGLVLISFSK
jgi:hypothetical protein